MTTPTKPFCTDEMTDAFLSLADGLLNTYQGLCKARLSGGFSGRGVVVPADQTTVALGGQNDFPIMEGYSSLWNRFLEREAASPDLPLTLLFHRLNASAFARFSLLLALAPELNRKYEGVFACLQNNVHERHCTLGLAADLYTLLSPLPQEELYSLLDSQNPINRFVLVSPQNAAFCLSRPLALRTTVLHMLLGVPGLPEPLPAACELPEGPVGVPLVNEVLIDRAARFAGGFSINDSSGSGLLQLYGAEGSGRRFILRKMAELLKTRVLFIDCDVLSAYSPDNRRTLLEAVLSYCTVTNYFPAFTHFDFEKLSSLERDSVAHWILRAATAVPLFAVCAGAPLKLEYPPGLRVLPIFLPQPTIGEQRLFWEYYLENSALPPAKDAESKRFSSLYNLTPGQIRCVSLLAQSECLSSGLSQITADAVAGGVRTLCRPALFRLTEPLSSHFTWDDLCLEQDQTEALRRVCDRIRCRWQVREKWGFDQKLPYGRGVSILLYGPPGTGKTMTAQVLAHEFGLDAYRVDMSRIFDKYIGETEKKLGELFDAARDANAVLFFDEADALFAKRTGVEDSKDRYANAETAYLLQRMEAYNGVSILATNTVQNFDEAFKRRITFMINLSLPGPETRKRLWHSVFPPQAPLAKEISLDFFAERFELSGSAIKSAALSAAYLAAARSTDITRDCLSCAIREEYQKTGRILMEHELY